MMNLLQDLKVKRRHLVVDEGNVLNVIRILNRYGICTNMGVGNCGWRDETKWFIHFDMSGRKWDRLTDELNVIRVWKNCDIPKGITGNIYSND